MTITLTRPAPAGPPSGTAAPAPDLNCIVAVTPSGRLRLPTAPAGPSVAALNRRTRTGITYHVDLDGGIRCWLDGDHHAGELNWVATQMCDQLSGGRFTGPDDAPFVCGLVLFTATSPAGPVGLSEQQLQRVVDAHAAASTDELVDPAPADVADPQLAMA